MRLDVKKKNSGGFWFLQKITLTTCSWSLFPPSLSFPLSLSSLCREGHQASGDPVPQEESKRPPPAYCFFITYYLCLTDLLQTNGCHMEKERQRRRKEVRKEKLSLSTSSFLLWPSKFLIRVAEIFDEESRLANGSLCIRAARRLIELMEISILSLCREMYSFCGL